MAAVVVFDNDAWSEGSETMSDYGTAESSTGTTLSEGAVLERDFPRYLPPARRNLVNDMGDNTVVYKNPDDPDRIQGVDNHKFQRLLINVTFALTKAMVAVLHGRFPGMYFHSSGHNNHDHPISHVVTQVGTRMLQRLIGAGSRILDVYGNPRACMRFNASQRNAANPKFAEALVYNFGGPDFIREINKWGPIDVDGVQAYRRDVISAAVNDGYTANFDVFQMIHTLYYVTCQDIMRLLHGSGNGKKKILALIHTHTKSNGFINNGEQEYWVKGGMVKQKNVSTGTCYYHPDITPVFFGEDKVYMSDRPGEKGKGYTWECHLVCEDTWIIEIVAIQQPAFKPSCVIDFKSMWDEACEVNEVRPIEYSAQPPRMLPTDDGKFVELDVISPALFNKLRASAAGQKRDAKLVADLLRQAKHLSDPGSLFPDAIGISCPPHLLIDHVLAAFIVDRARETDLLKAVGQCKVAMREHAQSLKGGVVMNDFSLASIVETFRATVKTGIVVNRVVRSKDVIGSGLVALDEALS